MSSWILHSKHDNCIKSKTSLALLFSFLHNYLTFSPFLSPSLPFSLLLSSTPFLSLSPFLHSLSPSPISLSSLPPSLSLYLSPPLHPPPNQKCLFMFHIRIYSQHSQTKHYQTKTKQDISMVYIASWASSFNWGSQVLTPIWPIVFSWGKKIQFCFFKQNPVNKSSGVISKWDHQGNVFGHVGGSIFFFRFVFPTGTSPPLFLIGWPDLQPPSAML